MILNRGGKRKLRIDSPESGGGSLAAGGYL